MSGCEGVYRFFNLGETSQIFLNRPDTFLVQLYKRLLQGFWVLHEFLLKIPRETLPMKVRKINSTDLKYVIS